MQRRQKQPQQQQRSDDVVPTQLCAFAGLRLGETCAALSCPLLLPASSLASPPLSRVAPPRADAANAMFCAIYVQCAGDGGDVPTRVATGRCATLCATRLETFDAAPPLSNLHPGPPSHGGKALCGWDALAPAVRCARACALLILIVILRRWCAAGLEHFL